MEAGYPPPVIATPPTLQNPQRSTFQRPISTHQRKTLDATPYSPSPLKTATPIAIRIAFAIEMGSMYFQPSSMS